MYQEIIQASFSKITVASYISFTGRYILVFLISTFSLKTVRKDWFSNKWKAQNFLVNHNNILLALLILSYQE